MSCLNKGGDELRAVGTGRAGTATGHWVARTKLTYQCVQFSPSYNPEGIRVRAFRNFMFG